MKRTLSLALVVALGGCVDDAPLGTDDQDIMAGTLADTWMVQRAVKPQFPCTATLIAPRVAITALHCTQYNKAGTTVHFYTSASGFAPALARTVVSVAQRPGTATAPNEDLFDTNGQYADLALLKLDADAPASSVPATLMWWYPGEDQTGYVIGAGNHDNAGTNPNSVGELRYRTQTTKFADDDDGAIYTDQHDVNGGDSGGPLYQYRKIFGVLHGSSYTSVPEHLDWILGQISYAWPFNAATTGIYRSGTTMQVFGEATERMCQYACQHSPCDAYNYNAAAHSCVLVQDVSLLLPSAAYRSASK